MTKYKISLCDTALFERLVIVVFLFWIVSGEVHARTERGRGAGAPRHNQDRGGTGRIEYGALSYVASGDEFPGTKGLQQAKLKCPGTGSFQWVYLSKSKGPMCTRALGNDEFYKVLDTSFSKCIARGARAAGIPSEGGNFKGRVFHRGVIGDDEHKLTRSLHNVGRAIDLAKIEVNGQVMDFTQASAQYAAGKQGKEYKFFEGFRQCWSVVARSSDSSCRGKPSTNAGYFGSLGWDDRKHQHHLHISLPVCDQQGYRATSHDHHFINIENLLRIIIPSAYAARFNLPDKVSLKLSTGDHVVGRADFIGEPVDEPVEIKLDIKCKNTDLVKVVEKSLNACNFISVKEDPAQNLILITSTPEFNDETGTLQCGRSQIKVYKNPCLNR